LITPLIISLLFAISPHTPAIYAAFDFAIFISRATDAADFLLFFFFSSLDFDVSSLRYALFR